VKRKSVIDSLSDRAAEIKVLVQKLGEQSSITDLNEQDRQEEMWGERSSVVVIRANPWAWDELPAEGTRIQHELKDAYSSLREIAQAMIRGRVRGIQQRFKEADKFLSNFIEHDVAGSDSVAKDVDRNMKHLDDLVNLVAEAADGSDHRTVFVPDTNALLHNPKIEDWSFLDAEQFRLVLPPTVLGELDKLKVEHRNEAVRGKAEQLIRQIKEYGRRGKLNTGVPILKGVSEIVGLAIEPVMAATLSWLDKDNADDRLIASTIEVMRLYPHSPVILVTRDVNVQNKANFAGIPFEEPPDPRS
jgi:rRNA-processing protein FCF1